MSWNTAALLGQCLASIPGASEGLDVEVVVVDNDSADDSRQVAAKYAGVTLIANDQNVGYARAMNQALTGGDGRTAEVLVALNPDTVLPARSLTVMVDRLLDEPDVGLVAPQLVNPDGSPQYSVQRFPSVALSLAASLMPARLRRGPMGGRWLLDGSDPPPEPADVDWAIGAVHVIRAAALDGELPYDERWFMYVEDLDLCWRLAERGWRRVFDPSVRVMHVGNASGIQAWGSARTKRWMDATYDWFQLRHGRRATRRWAAANAAGSTVRLVPALARRAVGRPLRNWESELRLALPVHLSALRRGGPPSATLP